MEFLYFLMAILTTTVGALTGTGGGIIMKPVLDLLAHYKPSTIGFLTSVSVFSMALVSVIKTFLNKTKLDFKIILPLAGGAVLGGLTGQIGLEYITSMGMNTVIIQNTILFICAIIVFIYTKNREKVKSYKIEKIFPTFLVGMILGIVSGFLGIGGGPINIAVFMLLYSYGIKESSVSSTIIILFSQISKLVSILITTDISTFNLEVLPFVVVGSVTGGYLGSKFISKFTNKQIDIAFDMVQVTVIGLCLINIVKNI